jgi:hypothetical protein
VSLLAPETRRRLRPYGRDRETNTILVNGVPVFLANADDPVDFSRGSVDPGATT